jgi:outer membrane protein TolC
MNTLLLSLLLTIGPPGDALELTLDDAIQLARSNNLSIRALRLDAEAAFEGFQSAWGQFDTVFFASGNYSDRRTPPSAQFINGVPVGGSLNTTETEFSNWSTGFRGTFLTGTTWTFDIGPQQIETDSGGVTIEQFTGDWSLDVTHPLLRDGADDYAVSSLELARHDTTIAFLTAEEQANSTLQAVTQAYWNLVFARQDLRTRELSVELASELLDITQRKFDQGLQNRINVTEVEAELATRREELLRAVTTEQNAEDELRRLVLAPEEQEQWERQLVLLTDPAEPQGVQLDLEAVIATALQYRPDVARAREALRRSEVEQRRARNQARPQLDLTAGYGINANADSYGEIYEDLDDSTFNESRVGVSFELPIGNRGAGYELRRRQVNRVRAGVDLRDSEMTTIAEVRTAVREVELQIARVSATAETTRLQREVYEGEVRRLENDLSTPFQVRQAQRDLLTAIDQETRARLDLEVARTDLLAVQGRLLYVYGYERSFPELSLEDEPPRP